MGEFWRKFLDAFVKALYPPRCPSCGALVGDFRFCDHCSAEVRFLSPPWCEICGRPFDPLAKARGVCADCFRSRPHFVKARSATLYDGPVAEAIKALKYSGRTAVSRVLGALLAEAVSSLDAPLEGAVLIPVPLHRKRLLERGFNQSELLAKEAGGRLGLRVERKVLVRKVHTRPQVELSGRERKENVKGAFSVERAELVRGRVLVVVDDVMTTGATLDECAKALRKAGAREVYAATVARQVTDF